MYIKVAICNVALATVLWGGGGQPSKQNPSEGAPNSAEVRISSEMAPAGGTVQVKFALTSPQPIMSGGTPMSAYALNGVALTSPFGDSAGVALQRGNLVYVSAISPLGDLGTSEYPFLTLTMSIPSDAKAGTVLPMDFLPRTSLVNAAGPVSITTKPGVVTVGGSFFINAVRPGGGTYPAGTVVRIEGQGFQDNASLRTPEMKFSSYKVVSSSEIDFVLKEQTTLDGKAVQVVSGGITQTFYSYLRGTPLQAPSRTLLKSADPAFQQLTHSLAQVGPLAAPTPGQYVAIALQNPNPGPAAVTLTVTHTDGTTNSNLIVMPSASRIMDDIATLIGCDTVRAGDIFNLVSTAPIQILGIDADEMAWTAKPFFPSF